jgi:hypothetical protein
VEYRLIDDHVVLMQAAADIRLSASPISSVTDHSRRRTAS